MTTALDWDRDGRDWPLRRHSRFVTVGHLRWHVQVLPRSTDTPVNTLDGSHSRLTWLLHGTGASTHTWRDLAPLLAQHTDVISVDLPGHAFTRGAVDADLTLPGMARALLELRKTLEHKGPITSDPPGQETWIGHSAGAAVALQAMRLDPTAVPQVISLNGALLPWGGRASNLFMPLARGLALLPWTGGLFAWSARRPGAVRELLRDTGSDINEEGQRLYERLAHDESHVRQVVRMMAQWELEPFERELPLLQGRVTLITSAQDTTVPPSVSARAARLIPRARLIALPRWGHLGHEEAPAEWVSLILQSMADMPT